MEINFHLEESRQSHEVASAASVLLSKFKRGFRHITDPSDSDHDPLFLACTLLDPRYWTLFNPNQMKWLKRNGTTPIT